jgi:hypothetical protein
VYGCAIKFQCSPGSTFENVSFSNLILDEVTGPSFVSIGSSKNSPHAGELYSEHDRIAGPQFRSLEAFIEGELVREFRRASVKAAEETAQLLMAATHMASR